MLGNLRIGTRMAAGFVFLLLLFVAVGGLIWLNLGDVQTKTEDLAGPRFREINIAHGIERSALDAVSNFRGFVFSEEERYGEAGEEALERTRGYLGDAAELARATAGMERLEKGRKQARHALERFGSIAAEAQKAVSSIQRYRNRADQASTTFTKSMNSFIENEYAELRNEVEFEMGAEAILARTERIREAHRIVEGVGAIEKALYRAQTLRDTGIVDRAMEELPKIRSTLEELEGDTYVRASKKELGAVLEALSSYEQAVGDLVESWNRVAALYTDLEEAAGEVIAVAGDVNRSAVTQVNALADGMVSQLKGTVRTVLVAVALSVLASMAVCTLVHRSMARPLRSVVEMARRGGEGDLTVSRGAFGLDTRDEVGEIAGALEKMVSSQREIVRSIVEETKGTAERVVALSEVAERSRNAMQQVTGAVEDVASRSESNSAALEETNAGIEEVSGSAQSAADSSAEGAESSKKTRETATDATERVEAVMNDVLDVNRSSERNLAGIRSLSESVEQISTFVNTINNIADQTNLLALNAAIEAARAGEAGRGFAVVAEEVRKLAEESGKAAGEISSLIETLEGQAAESIDSTRETKGVLERTLKRAGEARGKLHLAVQEIENVDNVVQNLAAVSEEQAASSREMAEAVDQVTQGTTEVVQRVEEIRSSSQSTLRDSEAVVTESERVSESARRIRELLARFRIDGAVDADEGLALPEQRAQLPSHEEGGANISEEE